MTLESLVNELLVAISGNPGLVATLIAPFVASALFAYISYRLNLKLELRREYNAVAFQVREALLAESVQLPLATEGLSSTQLRELRSVQIGWFRRLRFHYAACNYSAAKGIHKPGVTYRNPEAVEEAIDRLWTLTKRIR
ncbi:MAG: hypothetical protein LBE75_05015 [Burkholderiales bacterium]|nr:hypothetical protein [Burkholderiales bacterium]